MLLIIFPKIVIVFCATDFGVMMSPFFALQKLWVLQKSNRGHAIGVPTVSMSVCLHTKGVSQRILREGRVSIYRVPKILSPASPRPGRM